MEKTETCLACKGKKVVKKTSLDGQVFFYADRTTVIREPCKMCNGSGLVIRRKTEVYKQ